MTTISFFGYKIHINGSQEINTPLLLAFRHYKFLFSQIENLMSSQKTVCYCTPSQIHTKYWIENQTIYIHELNSIVLVVRSVLKSLTSDKKWLGYLFVEL